MSIVIDYFDAKRKAAGISSHAALARMAWPTMDPDKAAAYWKRLRNASGYERPQRLQYDDIRALCNALGLDMMRVQFELDELMKKQSIQSP